MKHKIKKNRLKIFIALSLMITCLVGVMFATNTFAYSSVNTISDTLTLYEQDYTNSTCLNRNTYLQDGYIDYRVNNNSGYITYVPFTINDTNYTTENYPNYCIVINCIRLRQDGVIDTDNTTGFSNGIYPNVSSISGASWTTTYYNFINKNNIKYKTFVINLASMASFNTSIDYNGHKALTLGFRGTQFQSSDTSWQGIRIYNIDFIKYEDLYTSKYVEDIETQFNQLLQDYEDLENDYNDLENNYTQLENDYNDLEDNYETLENNYEELQQDLDNLTQTIDNGLWSYASGVVAFGNGYGASYTTYQDILNANIIKDFTFDCVATYPTYTQQNNGINGNVYIVMGVLPNENTSNWNEVKYTPASLLNFNINTNITDYIKITVDLTTTNNAYQNRILQINKSNIELMNYEITSQKLEGLYDYNASDYRVERIRIEWTKMSNNDYLYLVSTNLNYTNGYTLGYYDGLKAINYENIARIEEQQNQIQQLEQRIESLETTIETKNEQIANYARSSYGLNNLMWTIGSTPFESFKQIWNVEFLGVDIANFILGIITTFIGLYIVKKFFL